jgi:hypothetical protein
VSSEARLVHKAAYEVVKSAERSHALFGKKASALARLTELAFECAEAGWDGADALPWEPAALALAQQLVRCLPDDIPMPEFAIDPDGSIALDWILARDRLFSLSTGRNNRLAFAWLDGTDKGHGAARFDGRMVPRRVLDGIREILGVHHSALRAA